MEINDLTTEEFYLKLITSEFADFHNLRVYDISKTARGMADSLFFASNDMFIWMARLF